MTEKEKMLQGKIYDANNDEELLRERQLCKELCVTYNHLEYSKADERKAVLSKILPHMGVNVTIEPNFYCDYGYNIKIGNNFYINHNSVFLDEAEISFGDNVFIGPNCGFFTASHPFDVEQRNQGLETAKPIYVGNNVWIGGNVCFLGGVKIGNNSIIGTGSVVTRDTPDNVIAVGNPCKIIKQL